MKFLKKDEEYKKYVKDIIENKEFKALENIPHHGETRIMHSAKVSYYSYKISKMLKLDARETARAGLLHDFYLDRTIDYDKIRHKVKLYTVGHPGDALENANKIFDLSDKEKDIIRAHMFPVDFRVPRYLEAWIVNIVDKFVSTTEFTRKFSYQLSTVANIWIILAMNTLK